MYWISDLWFFCYHRYIIYTDILSKSQWIVTNYTVTYLALKISEVQLKKEECLSII